MPDASLLADPPLHINRGGPARVLASISVQLSYPLAFLAGLVSFLSPCVFPLFPAYLAFLGGRVGVRQLAAAGAGAQPGADGPDAMPGRAPLVANGLSFVAGFSAVFVTFFYVFSALDVTLLRSHQKIVNLVGGAIVVLLALEVLGVIRLRFLMRERRLSVARPGGGAVPAFLLGVSFAAGWTPCIGPQLAAILTVASSGDFGGLPLMLVYCAGLALPFLAFAVLADQLQGVIQSVNRHLGIVNLAAGALLLLFGLLLLTDQFTFFNRFGAHPPFDL